MKKRSDVIPHLQAESMTYLADRRRDPSPIHNAFCKTKMSWLAGAGQGEKVSPKCDDLALHRPVEQCAVIEQRPLQCLVLDDHVVDAAGRMQGSPINESWMQNYVRLMRLDRKVTAPIALRSLREHVEIILACKERDTEKAVAALQRLLGMF